MCFSDEKPSVHIDDSLANCLADLGNTVFGSVIAERQIKPAIVAHAELGRVLPQEMWRQHGEISTIRSPIGKKPEESPDPQIFVNPSTPRNWLWLLFHQPLILGVPARIQRPFLTLGNTS
jgi:hypothetical protein